MIHIVGLGIGDTESLSDGALLALSQSSVVIGSKRQLACVYDTLVEAQEQLHYPSPFRELVGLLENKHKENDNICLLASGDPLFYGVSDLLLRHFSVDQLAFYSNVSSVQAAFSRIKKSWQSAKMISLHGRPLSNLIPYLKDNQRYGLLTDKHSHPQAVAALLCEYGCENAQLWICENLGDDYLGDEYERILSFSAKELAQSDREFHPLHVTIIETEKTSCNLPSFPGFDDHLFFTDTGEAAKGMMTKREIRLAALSLLQPAAGEVGWDVGAGCGTVAVEWAYWNQQSKVYAIEHHKKRLLCLSQNKHKFGVNNLTIVEGNAPAVLNSLERPNAVFIGGTGGEMAAIMNLCWHELESRGRLVVNCVTENCKLVLQQWLSQQQVANSAVEWLDISVSKGAQLAGQLLMRPRLPVRLLKITKV